MIATLVDFQWLADPNAWVALLTLTLLEIVLGIDNIVFISILVDTLPEEKRKQGRLMGLGLAMFARLLLLLSITWIMGLKEPLFHVPIHPSLWDMMPDAETHAGRLGISLKDIILLIGGGFLIYKSTKEIHHKLDDEDEGSINTRPGGSFAGLLLQIAVVDIVFSLDSVITAVGMVNDPGRISLMMSAVVISVAVMMVASGGVSRFVSKHPSVKMLALSFLILIGTALISEGLHFHIPKGYIYFSMAFSLGVEMLNLKMRARHSAQRVPEI